MPQKPDPPPVLGFTRRQLALVLTAAALVFSRVFGMSLVLPDFVSYGRTLTDSDVLVGTAFGAYGLTLALMQLPMGWLSDHMGRRPVLVAGTALFVAGSAWAALAPSIEQLLAARLLQGMGAISSTAMALVGESVPAERRTVAMAIVGVPAGMGFFFGMMAGPLLSPVIGVAGLFWVTAVVGAAALLPMLWLRIPEPLLAPVAATRRSLTAPVVGLALAGFTMNYALVTVLFFLGAADRTGWALLLPMLIIALMVMGGASRAVDKRGLTWQPIAALLPLLALGAAGAVLTDKPLLWLAGTLFFAAHATLSAVLPSQVSRLAGRSGGTGHGIQNIVSYGGTFVAGVVAGALAATPWIAMMVLAGLAVAVATAVGWNLRGSKTNAAQPTQIPQS